MTEKYTKMLLPGGEWLENTKRALKASGLEIQSTGSERNYRYTLVEQALPIIFDVIRSRDIPATIIDKDTDVFAGFTGSDIAKETGQDYLWTFDWVLNFFPERENPVVYIGSTPNLQLSPSNPLVNMDILNRTTIYTAYPNIAKSWLKDKYGLSPKIKERSGKIEGYWRVDKTNGAIIDIKSSGKTMKENRIELMETIMRPKLVFMQNPDLPREDRLRFNDLEELIYQAKYDWDYEVDRPG